MKKLLLSQILFLSSLFYSSMSFAQERALNIEEAMAKLTEGNNAAAIKICDSLTILTPGNAKIYLIRGLAKNSAHLPYSALKDFNKSISLDPSNSLALYSRGFLLAKIGKIKASRRDFKLASTIGLKETMDKLTEFEPE